MPFLEFNETDTELIAHNLDDSRCVIFRLIPFEDWVRWAQGYTAASVTGLINQSLATRDELSEHLQRVPAALKTYTQVEKASSTVAFPLDHFTDCHRRYASKIRS